MARHQGAHCETSQSDGLVACNDILEEVRHLSLSRAPRQYPTISEVLDAEIKKSEPGTNVNFEDAFATASKASSEHKTFDDHKTRRQQEINDLFASLFIAETKCEGDKALTACRESMQAASQSLKPGEYIDIPDVLAAVDKHLEEEETRAKVQKTKDPVITAVDKLVEGNGAKAQDTRDLASAAVETSIQHNKPRRQPHLARSSAPEHSRWERLLSKFLFLTEQVERPVWTEAMEAAIEEFEVGHPWLWIDANGVLAAWEEPPEMAKAERVPMGRKRKYQTKCRICHDSPRYMKQPRE